MKLEEVFICKRCGACCQGQAGILIRIGEVQPLARILDLSAEEFIRRYTEPCGILHSIKVGPDGYCLLREEDSGKCLVHEAKPAMCRHWPFFFGPLKFREGFEPVKNFCPGIHSEASWEDFIAFHRKFIRDEPPRFHYNDPEYEIAKNAK